MIYGDVPAAVEATTVKDPFGLCRVVIQTPFYLWRSLFLL